MFLKRGTWQERDGEKIEEGGCVTLKVFINAGMVRRTILGPMVLFLF